MAKARQKSEGGLAFSFLTLDARSRSTRDLSEFIGVRCSPVFPNPQLPVLHPVHRSPAIRDEVGSLGEVLNKFIKQSQSLSKDDVALILLDAGVEERRIENVLDMLLWFSFLGVIHKNEHHYSYQLEYNLPKIKSFVPNNPSVPAFIIHPAFRMALNPSDSNGNQQNLFK